MRRKQQATELVRLNSLTSQNDIETPLTELLSNTAGGGTTLDNTSQNHLANNTNSSSSISSSSSTSSSSCLLLNSQLSQTTTTPTSNGNNPGGSVIADPSLFKPAPKKNILFRAVSQNDSLTAENNHSKPDKFAAIENDKSPNGPQEDGQKKLFNIPLIDQFESNNGGNGYATATADNDNRQTTTTTTTTTTQVGNPVQRDSPSRNNNHVLINIGDDNQSKMDLLANYNMISNGKSNESGSIEFRTSITLENLINNNDKMGENQGGSSSSKKARTIKSSSKPLNIAEKMKILNKNPSIESIIEFNQAESTSANSLSSSDEMVTSSDQTRVKQKKRRLIELNTEERKLQIRSSNREAARRCRERRRNYISFLEANIQTLENKVKDLTSENSTLKKFISEHKSGSLTSSSSSSSSNNSADLASSNTNIGAYLNELNQLKTMPIFLTLQLPPNNNNNNNGNQEPSSKNKVSNLVLTTPGTNGTSSSSSSSSSATILTPVATSGGNQGEFQFSNSGHNPQLIQLLEQSLSKQASK